MTFRNFHSVFSGRPSFTVRDVTLRFPDFDDRQLHYWQQRGWVRLLRRPYYRVADRPWNLPERRAVANTVYAPSYISLESALGHYGFIPEGVFHITSITTRHAQTFELDGVRYFYRQVRPEWFLGYTIEQNAGIPVRMATPEKALLDLLHLHRELTSPADFESLRLDRIGIRKAIRKKVWNAQLTLSNNKALNTRAKAFQLWLHDNVS